jgi:hypothetical protein
LSQAGKGCGREERKLTSVFLAAVLTQLTMERLYWAKKTALKLLQLQRDLGSFEHCTLFPLDWFLCELRSFLISKIPDRLVLAVYSPFQFAHS